MKSASSHQRENEPQWKKQTNKQTVKRNTYKISSIKRVTRKFLEVSGCSHAKRRQRNLPKECAARVRAKLVFT